MSALADVRDLIARLEHPMTPTPSRAEIARILKAAEVELRPAIRRRNAELTELAPALRVMARLQWIGGPAALGSTLVPGLSPRQATSHGRHRLSQLAALGHVRRDPDGYRITPAGAEAARRLDDEREAEAA